ncbi:MAG: acetyl-coenzyme A synthetase N-terminal domain-containing protein, partial [Pseudomonadota bacterium]
MTSRYREVYDGWLKDPDGFWGEAAKGIDWVKPADKVFDPDAGIYGRWFSVPVNAVVAGIAERPGEP